MVSFILHLPENADSSGGDGLAPLRRQAFLPAALLRRTRSDRNWSHPLIQCEGTGQALRHVALGRHAKRSREHAHAPCSELNRGVCKTVGTGF